MPKLIFYSQLSIYWFKIAKYIYDTDIYMTTLLRICNFRILIRHERSLIVHLQYAIIQRVLNNLQHKFQQLADNIYSETLAKSAKSRGSQNHYMLIFGLLGGETEALIDANHYWGGLTRPIRLVYHGLHDTAPSVDEPWEQKRRRKEGQEDPENSQRTNLPLAPARFDWSIRGCTIRRLALMNLRQIR